MEWIPVSLEKTSLAETRLRRKHVFSDGLLFSPLVPTQSKVLHAPSPAEQVAVIERPSFAFVLPVQVGDEVRAASQGGVIVCAVNRKSSAAVYVFYSVCLDAGLGAYYVESLAFQTPVRILSVSAQEVHLSAGPASLKFPCHGKFRDAVERAVSPKAVTHVILFHVTTSFARLKKTLLLGLLSPNWAEALGRNLGVSGCGWLANSKFPTFPETSDADVIFPTHIYMPPDRGMPPTSPRPEISSDPISILRLALKTLLMRVPCPVFGSPCPPSRLESEICSVARRYGLSREAFPFLLREKLISDPRSGFFALRLLPLGDDEGWTRRETQTYVAGWLRQRRSEISCIPDSELKQQSLEELKLEISRFVNRPNIQLLRFLQSEIASFGLSSMEPQCAFVLEDDPCYDAIIKK